MSDYTIIFTRVKTLADKACGQLKTLREMRPYDQLKTGPAACKDLAAELKRIIKYHSLARGTAKNKLDVFLRRMLASQDPENEHYYLEPEWCQSNNVTRKALEKCMILRLCAMTVPRDEDEIVRGFSVAKSASAAAECMLDAIEESPKTRTVRHLTVYNFEKAHRATPRR